MGPLNRTPPASRAAIQASRLNGHGRQGGFMLVIALIIMVIMTLSSVAMIVSLRGGISASANIAFRQAATRSADVAVDSAYQWVRTQMTSSTTSLNDGLAPADVAEATVTPAETTVTATRVRYYATMNGADSGCKKDGVADAFTPTSYRFGETINGADGFPCATRVSGNPAGYTIYYVIHRMANTSETACIAAGGAAGCGTCPTAGCLQPAITGSSTQTGMSQSATGPVFSTTSSNEAVYYRITVKVAGPRQNNRYIQGFIF
jgi:type II secretory pathway pseudopilin PulG